ncbi:AraC family transcriptional regulator [Cohnella sp. CIP 111063]|uniref:AraC family transcriptional regulator n=1 Tax=unclassified Cohnella TaxID=2636738 RepID=UPI000B8C466A|nr:MULTISPECIES: AraC family transcriptional regulator [unclassified Cohnella]OXS53083.1 AraC family transcriptional regulator [Cohnella sp. CIP 111063]PRX60594.1 AraC-like DNA-binding protein [Cohnella sp. SGD-V74]
MDIGSLFDSALLDRHYSPRIFAYYFKHWNGYDMAFHRHDSTEIMYVIHGSCAVEWQEERKAAASARLGKGEFILLDAGVPHRLVVEGSCRMLNVEFGFAPHKGELPSVKTFAEEDASLRELLAVRRASMTLQDPDEVYHALKSLVLELDYQGGDGKLLDRMLLIQLLIRIGRLRTETERNFAPQAGQYVKASIAYLVQNYDRPLTVKDVAASVNLHPGYLQRIFKAQTNRTMIEYLTDIRIEKAKMLLERTDVPVADISDYVGAGSRPYFHALFKKHTSMTPVEYRIAMGKQRFAGSDFSSEKSEDF